jgi:hypothetical protein
MPIVRGIRTINALEAGTLSGSGLESLVQADPSRAVDINSALQQRSQARRLAQNDVALTALVTSPLVANVVFTNSIANTILIPAIANSANAVNAMTTNDGNFERLLAANNETAFYRITTSAVAMQNVISSNTRMHSAFQTSPSNVVFSRSITFMDAVKKSQTAITTVTSSNVAFGKFLAAHPTGNAALFANALFSNSTILVSPTAVANLNTLLANTFQRAVVFSNNAAVAYMANTDTAMQQITANTEIYMHLVGNTNWSNNASTLVGNRTSMNRIGASNTTHRLIANSHSFGNRQMTTAAQWGRMVCGDGKFVCVRGLNGTTTGTIATSHDGYRWSEATPASIAYSDIVHNGTRFIAIAGRNSATTTFAHSADPINIGWSTGSLPSSETWSAIAYGRGGHVAIAGGSAASTKAAYSVDGITWRAVTMPAELGWSSVAYGEGLFVAVGGDQIAPTNVFATSPDGLTWTARTLPIQERWTRVKFANGMFIAIAGGLGATSRNVAYSYDGINWELSFMPQEAKWIDLEYANGLWVAVPGYSVSYNYVATSTDGINWQYVPFDNPYGSTVNPGQLTLHMTGIAYGEGKWVISTGGGSATPNLLYSHDGVTWSLGINPNASGTFHSLMYNGSNTFIAIGGSPNSSASNGVIRSTDGYNWLMSNTMPSTGYTFARGAQGNGWFVTARNNTGNFATRTRDGIRWEQTCLPQSFWADATFDNNRYMAVAGSQTVTNMLAYSDDGITWTSSVFPVSSRWSRVRYGNGVWIAIAGEAATTNIAARSTDNGLTWVQITLPATLTWTGLAYSSTLRAWVAVAGTASATASYAISFDNGITWQLRTMPSNTTWSGITWTGTNFVAIAGGSGATTIAATSPDGLNWTARTLPTSATWKSVEFANNVVVTVAGHTTATTAAATSVDNGASWTARTLPTSAIWNGLAYANGVWMSVAGFSGANTAATTSSDNGVTWVSRSLPVSASWSGVAAAANGRFVAITGGTTSNTITAYSDNAGVTWVQAHNDIMPANTTWSALAYGNNTFVAVAGWGGATQNVATSNTDGITWVSRTLPSSQQWTDVQYSNGVFVAVAGAGTSTTIAATSADNGATWTSRTLPTSISWNKLAVGDGTIVAVGGWPGAQTAVCATSTDNGTSWTSRSLPFTASWADVAYGAGVWYAYPGMYENNGTTNLARSIDQGITWTTFSPTTGGGGLTTDQRPMGTVFANGVFITISGGNAAVSRFLTSGG